MLTAADVLHLFANELSGLGRRGFSFPPGLASPFHCLLFRHKNLLKGITQNQFVQVTCHEMVELGQADSNTAALYVSWLICPDYV
jgi:hypothetical protein